MSEQLHKVKKVLGRFYGRMDNPTKTEARMYEDAATILQGMIDDGATPEPTTAEAVKERGVIDPDWTVDEVKRQVRDGNIGITEAIEAEKKGKGRVTLLEWLEEEQGDEA